MSRNLQSMSGIRRDYQCHSWLIDVSTRVWYRQ